MSTIFNFFLNSRIFALFSMSTGSVLGENAGAEQKERCWREMGGEEEKRSKGAEEGERANLGLLNM